MSEVILINPPSRTTRFPEEHTGLEYLAAIVKKSGTSVKYIDCPIEGFDEDKIVNLVLSEPDLLIVGLSPFVDSIDSTISIIRQIKNEEPNLFICLGGFYATFACRELFEIIPEVSVVVRGEGEITLLNLINCIKSGQDWTNLKGIAYSCNMNVIINGAQNLVENLDSLPYPLHPNINRLKRNRTLIHISSSRGCLWNCGYCSVNSFFKISSNVTWRSRSPENVADEIEYLNKEHDVMWFKFVDDCFLGPKGTWVDRSNRIAKAIKRKDMRIHFALHLRPDMVLHEVIAPLIEVGLFSVTIGIESGIQRSLDFFEKKTTVKTNQVALNILKNYDLNVRAGFIGYDPYVTLPELYENLQFLRRNINAIINHVGQPLYLNPYTHITSFCESKGLIRDIGLITPVCEIVDRKARLVFDGMQIWNKSNLTLYYSISNVLAAPMAITTDERKKYLNLYIKLRNIELDVFESVLNYVQGGGTSLEDFVSGLIDSFSPSFHSIENILAEINIVTK